MVVIILVICSIKLSRYGCIVLIIGKVRNNLSVANQKESINEAISPMSDICVKRDYSVSINALLLHRRHRPGILGPYGCLLSKARRNSTPRDNEKKGYSKKCKSMSVRYHLVCWYPDASRQEASREIHLFQLSTYPECTEKNTFNKHHSEKRQTR